mmetsp:Transcript_17122/g.20741  ORF Transcript_17122/g.20741 Transcript_17122/m.20741 type:complete len:178 (+) Transcript_17122:74-607(+)
MSSESGIWAGSSDLQEFRPRVFITNAFGARNLVKLKEKGITHVLIAGNFLDKPFASSNKIRIEYEQLNLNDNATKKDRDQMLKAIPVAMNFIESALGLDPVNRVVIHCGAGRSRSGAIATAYNLHAARKEKEKNGPLFESVKQEIDHSLKELQKLRPIIEPNDAFLEALEMYFTTEE